MATQKTQGYQALNIYNSDNANIPYTKIVAKGVTDTAFNNFLIAVSGTFTPFTQTVYAGDIVYNRDTQQAATVIKIQNDSTLELNAPIFTNAAGGESFTVFSASAVTNYQDANNGCVLYIGTAGDLTVDTIAGSENVLFKSVPVGFFPVQVKKVYSTGTVAKDIVALW
tara:strand:- start:868 stop:1371 length:504 start_codon:yes stop_codon:yes gene_type:complete